MSKNALWAPKTKNLPDIKEIYQKMKYRSNLRNSEKIKILPPCLFPRLNWLCLFRFSMAFVELKNDLIIVGQND